MVYSYSITGLLRFKVEFKPHALTRRAVGDIIEKDQKRVK
jgi:hypothetical protein